MGVPQWILLLGLLLLAMVFVNSLLHRLPLTTPMIYLALGALLGPAGLDALRPDPATHAALLEHLAEIGLLVSLFAVGISVQPRLRERRWRLPVKLAFVSLSITVALLAAVGVYLLGLPLGAAVLLGAILAPTDPVLASALQPADDGSSERLSFTLAAEGGLNDGSAFPFVMLGLGLLGISKQPLSHWLLVDLLWATLGGLGIGAALGGGVGKAVVLMRSRYNLALGLDVFLGLGLVSTSYAVAQLLSASGFLAVFAAGIALGGVREEPQRAPDDTPAPDDGSGQESETMRSSVETFNEQMERVAEIGLVLLVGAMLPYAHYTQAIWWFVPLLFLVIRPLSVLPAYLGERAGLPQLAMTSWFGIRGIGSVFYLLLVLRSGVTGPAAQTLVSLTLWTIAASIVVHGMSAGVCMRWYAVQVKRRRLRASQSIA